MNEDKKIVIDAKDQVMVIDKETRKKIKSVLKECADYYNDNNFDALARYSENALKEIPDTPKGLGDNQISDIFMLVATAFKELGNKDRAKELAVLSAQFNRTNMNTLWLIRELNSAYSENSRLIRMQVSGEMYFLVDGDVMPQPFRTIYGVVAESTDEALDYIKEFERIEVRDSLKIIKHNDIESKPDLPKGVYESMRLVADISPEEEGSEI